MKAAIEKADLAALADRFAALQAARPNDFFLSFQWASILCDRGRWAEAVEILRPALELLPLHFEARKLPALALCRIGRAEQAADVLLGRDARRGFFVADYALEIMRVLADTGDRPTAAAFGRALLQRAPRLPYRGHVEAALRKLEGAP